MKNGTLNCQRPLKKSFSDVSFDSGCRTLDQSKSQCIQIIADNVNSRGDDSFGYWFLRRALCARTQPAAWDFWMGFRSCPYKFVQTALIANNFRMSLRPASRRRLNLRKNEYSEYAQHILKRVAATGCDFTLSELLLSCLCDKVFKIMFSSFGLVIPPPWYHGGAGGGGAVAGTWTFPLQLHHQFSICLFYIVLHNIHNTKCILYRSLTTTTFVWCNKITLNSARKS